MTEIERLRQWEIAGREWLDKTDWMQSRDAPVRWLGKHRADCLREEVERLTAERDRLRKALLVAQSLIFADRVALHMTSSNPDGTIDHEEDRAALAEYDDVLALIGAALGVER